MNARPAPPPTIPAAADPRLDIAGNIPVRSRASSAPETKIAEPVIRSRTTHGARNASEPAPNFEAELSRLINELTNDFSVAAPGGGDSETRELRKTIPDVHELLVDTLRQELAIARHAIEDGRRLEALNGALLLLHAADTPVRNEVFPEIANLLGRCTATESSIQCALSLVRGIAGNASDPDKAHAVAVAQQTLSLLSEATRHFPFEARCELAVAGLYAAADIDSVTVARTVLQALLDGHQDNDPQAAGGRIAAFAAALPRVPDAYRVLAAMKLYQYAPTSMPWSLQSLEGIAGQNNCLPETTAAFEFCVMLNQDIYRLRMDSV